jgi:hypothetical protein
VNVRNEKRSKAPLWLAFGHPVTPRVFFPHFAVSGVG